jgi:hypothetical protein
MKKLLLALGLTAFMVAESFAAVISYTSTNLINRTNLVYTGRARIYQITWLGSTDNNLKFYDSATNTLTFTNQGYTYATNYTISITNLQTNAIYVYATSTQYQIQTNIYINANARSNVTVGAAMTAYPLAFEMGTLANVPTTAEDIDLNFVNGISYASTNAGTLIIYTRP